MYVYQPIDTGEGIKADCFAWIHTLKKSSYFRKFLGPTFLNVMIVFKNLFNCNMWLNPLSDVMGGWWIWKTQADGTVTLTTECFENIFLMLIFTFLLMKTAKEKLLKDRQICFMNILWYSIKVAFLFSLTIELFQLFLWLGIFRLSDLCYNTLGGAIGGMLYWMGWKIKRRFSGELKKDVIKFVIPVFIMMIIGGFNIMVVDYVVDKINPLFDDINSLPKVNMYLILLLVGLTGVDFVGLIIVDCFYDLNENILSGYNELADLGNNFVAVIALYTAAIPVIYNSHDKSDSTNSYDEYVKYEQKKYNMSKTFSNINSRALEIGICILAVILAIKGYKLLRKCMGGKNPLREFLKQKIHKADS